MLTPEQLRAMTPEAQTQLFTGLATAYYGAPDFPQQLADDFGVNKATVYRWKKDNNTPWAVIFTLDLWVNSGVQDRNVLQDWQDVPAQLTEAAAAMAKVGVSLARIARRLPAVRGGGPAS